MFHNNPSTFVTKLSYAIVGYDHSRTCYIGNSDTNIYPNKYPPIVKMLIFKFLKKLFMQRGYVSQLYVLQMSKFHIYLGNSCTYAHKRNDRNMKQNAKKTSLVHDLLGSLKIFLIIHLKNSDSVKKSNFFQQILGFEHRFPGFIIIMIIFKLIIKNISL